MSASDEADFSEFVHASSGRLLRAAWVMTGDHATAQDLVQASLAHTWVRWSTIRSKPAAEVYVRRVMTTTFLGWRRRRWTGETAVDDLPEPESADPTDMVLDRQVLLAALRDLPPHQRAVIALRYLDDLSEATTAEILGCSVGTVKSQSARAIRTLRAAADLQPALSEGAVDDRL